MRVQSTVTNYYIYGAGLLYEIDEAATTTNTLTYHFDSRGSTIAITDGNTNVTDRIEYSAYGLVTYRAGSADTPFLYNGRYGVMSDANGLLYMRARYYNPYLCRFINQDPSGFGGGMNFYAFADGNPISLIDPFGLGAVGEAQSFPSMIKGPTGWASDQVYDFALGDR
jgi:RHS repeat-associated protein